MSIFGPNIKKMLAEGDVTGLKKIVGESYNNKNIRAAIDGLVQIGTVEAYEALVACIGSNSSMNTESDDYFDIALLRADNSIAPALGSYLRSSYSPDVKYVLRLAELDPDLCAAVLTERIEKAIAKAAHGNWEIISELKDTELVIHRKHLDSPELLLAVEKAYPICEQVEERREAMYARMTAEEEAKRAAQLRAQEQKQAQQMETMAIGPLCSICGKSSDELMEVYHRIHPDRPIIDRTWVGICPTCGKAFCIVCASKVKDDYLPEMVPACPEHQVHLHFRR